MTLCLLEMAEATPMKSHQCDCLNMTRTMTMTDKLMWTKVEGRSGYLPYTKSYS